MTIMTNSIRVSAEYVMKSVAVLGLCFFITSARAQVDKMDVETHSIVIAKLETALAKAQEDETIELAPVRSRLADLYAERARLTEMEDVKKGCTKDCGAEAKSDRKKALALYEIVIKETSSQNQGPMAIHMAHLYQMLMQPKKAEAIYDRLIAEGPRKHTSEVLSLAYAGRAEQRYSRAQFRKSQDDFETAYRLAPAFRRGPIAHRIAWCELNQGDQLTAVAQLIEILKSPKLLTREAGEGAKVDLAFQEEVALDLGTFISRGSANEKHVNLVESLAPERSRTTVVRHFANETERLGHKRVSLAAWTRTAELESSKEEQLEIFVRIARLHYDLGEKSKTVPAFQRAVAHWRDNGCKKAGVDCDNLRKRLKNLVTDWNKAERSKPSLNLLDVYVAYVSFLGNDDVEMMFFAAQVAKDVKQPRVAADLYHKTSLLAVKSNLPQAKEMLETSLSAEIDMAEQSPKDKEGYAMREAAYDFYLKMAPRGRIAHSVRYQRARLPYEQGNHFEASKRLEAFALSVECKAAKAADRKLCLQAADLDLDALVILKDDRAIEKSALRYAGAYPEQRLEYYKIARTSALKQAQTMKPEQAIKKLASINTTGMQEEERLNLLKTRLALAEKAKDLDAVKVAGRELLAMKKLNPKDREFALSRLAWAAEMSFDFKSAYSFTKQMEMKDLKPADRELRLSMFAELAGLNPSKHDEAFLKLSRNSAQKAAVRAKMVRSSQNMAREFKRHESELMRFPKLAAPLALEIFAKSNDRKFAEKMLKSRAIAKEPAGRAMSRQLFLGDFMKIEAQLTRHKIKTRNDRQMQTTLAERLSLISKAESSAAKAIQSGDWTSQLVGLSVLSRENKRLHDEVLTLPVPRQLKGEMRIQYTKQVEAHAGTFLAKHQAIEEKLKPFWKDSAAIDSLVKDFESARPALRKLLVKELGIIAKVAPESAKNRLNRVASGGQDQPSRLEIASAVTKIKEKPFNVSRLEVLKELEASRGGETMVVYLDARVSKLKNEEARQ